jgi:hypothetical protein
MNANSLVQLRAYRSGLGRRRSWRCARRLRRVNLTPRAPRTPPRCRVSILVARALHKTSLFHSQMCLPWTELRSRCAQLERQLQASNARVAEATQAMIEAQSGAEAMRGQHSDSLEGSAVVLGLEVDDRSFSQRSDPSTLLSVLRCRSNWRQARRPSVPPSQQSKVTAVFVGGVE